jgi:ADP-ribosylglycohydrolase
MSSDAAAAVLFGLALGDALGYPVEFLDLRRIKAEYGAAGITEPPDPALYTDDTQMTVALAEGLLDAGRAAPLDDRMNAIGRRFVAWHDSADNNRAPGLTCMRGVERFAQGLPWHESGVVGSKGCGAAMRVAPIGYLYRHDDRALFETAEASARITHGHPAALAAAVGAAYLVKLALTGAHATDYLRRVAQFTDGVNDEFDAALYRIGHVLGWTDEEAALDHIGEGWVADEAVALALYCVLRYPDSYVDCLRRAANTNGDSDSIACIAGGIMGARLGLEGIPVGWRARCENRAYLEDLACRLANN